MIRVDGDVRRINLPPLEHKDVHGLIYEIMSDKQRRDFEEFLETDFSFEVPGVARFRVNAFNQNRGAGAVFRTIPSKVLTMDELGMGDVFKKICNYPRGIVLVTGPTGSGKSTTLAAMMDFINDNRFEHILTSLRCQPQGRNSLLRGKSHAWTLATILNALAHNTGGYTYDGLEVGEISFQICKSMKFYKNMMRSQVFSFFQIFQHNTKHYLNMKIQGHDATKVCMRLVRINSTILGQYFSGG